MTLKTDLKFAILILAIFGGILAFAWRAVYGTRTAALLESRMRLNMSPEEVGEVVGAKLVLKKVSDPQWPLVGTYTLPSPSGRPKWYAFSFDNQKRLQSVYVEFRGKDGSRHSYSPDLR